MKQLFELYRNHLVVRILLAALVVAAISATIAFAGLYQLRTVLESESRELSSMRWKSQAMPGDPAIVPHSVLELYSRFTLFGERISDFPCCRTGVYRVASEPVTQQAEYERFNLATSTPPWTDLLAYIAGRPPKRAFHYPTSLTPLMIMITDSLRAVKCRNPETSVIEPISAMLKYVAILGNLQEGLLPKVLEFSAQWSLDEGIHAFYRERLLSASEARNLLTELTISDNCQIPFHEAVRQQGQLAIRDHLEIFHQAPLGCYLLEKTVLESPEAITARAVERFSRPPLTADLQPTKRDPAYIDQFHWSFAIPLDTYLVDYWKDASKISICRDLLEQELALLAGVERTALDPYTGKPYLTAQVDGLTIFYSVGPNQIDDRLASDDIFLPLKPR